MQQLADISGFMSLYNVEAPVTETPNRLNVSNPSTKESMKGTIHIPKSTGLLSAEQINTLKTLTGKYLQAKQGFNQSFDKYRRAFGNLDPKEEDKSLWSYFYHNSIGLAKVNNYSNQLVDALNAMGMFIDNPSAYQSAIYRPQPTKRR